MEFKGVTYTCTQIEDQQLFDDLPVVLQDFYHDLNGLIAFNGGFHIRGCVVSPQWHSLFEAWRGKNALHKSYESLDINDIPFAQDCLGEQYILRGDYVYHLNTELDELDDLELYFEEFIENCIEDPIDFLSLHPLIQFHNEDGKLQPGELLNSYPPFCIENPSEEYELNAVPVKNQLQYLAKIAEQTRNTLDFRDLIIPRINF
jgi:hypothetical protein